MWRPSEKKRERLSRELSLINPEFPPAAERHLKFDSLALPPSLFLPHKALGVKRTHMGALDLRGTWL